MSVWDTRVICAWFPWLIPSHLYLDRTCDQREHAPLRNPRKKVARRFCLKNVLANLASLVNDQTSIDFYHLKPFLLLVFAFVLLIFWFIQFSLILLCLCDARSMASILVTMKVLSTIYTGQNITIMALVLIMFFHLSFPDGLSTRIANKTHHFHNVVHEERFPSLSFPKHVEFTAHAQWFYPLLNCGLNNNLSWWKKIHNKSTVNGNRGRYSTEEHFLLKASSIRDSLQTCCFQGHYFSDGV